MRVRHAHRRAAPRRLPPRRPGRTHPVSAPDEGRGRHPLPSAGTPAEPERGAHNHRGTGAGTGAPLPHLPPTAPLPPGRHPRESERGARSRVTRANGRAARTADMDGDASTAMQSSMRPSAVAASVVFFRACLHRCMTACLHRCMTACLHRCMTASPSRWEAQYKATTHEPHSLHPLRCGDTRGGDGLGLWQDSARRARQGMLCRGSG